MTTISDALIIYRLFNIPVYETIGALIEMSLLACGLAIKVERWEKKWLR